METDSETRVEEFESDSKLNGFAHPSYDGRSICNIPDTVAKILNLRAERPLNNPLVYEMKENVSNVVFVLIDGLGYDSIKNALANHGLLSFVGLEKKSLYFPITSVFPSTTSTATTSIHTGLTPQEHGIIGYSMYFKEFGTIADTLRFSPIVGGRRSLFELGLDAENFVGAKTIHEKFSSEGVISILYLNKWIVNSGLSKITGRGARVVPNVTAADMFARLRKNLEGHPRRSFHLAYYASPDTVAHARGPFSPEYAAEVESLFHVLKSELFERTDPKVARETLVMISSDHGLCQINDSDIIDVIRHPGLLGLLKIPPCGDSRALFLHVKANMEGSVVDYFEKHFRGQFELIQSKKAVSDGLFGLGKIKEGLEDRIGDMIAVPKKMIAVENSLLDTRFESVPGRHGGLSRNEMIVPFIVCKLA